MHYAHEQGVIHRDIKPENILLDRQGTAKLADLGLSKDLLAPTLTVTEQIMGTPHYISPEQAESKPVDGRADIYSLGIIFYEMLTGKKPFQGDSDIQIIISHLSEPVPSLPDGLEQYQELVDRMIAKNPDDRFATAEEMLRYIKAFRQSGCQSVRSRNTSDFAAATRTYSTSRLGNAFRQMAALRHDSGGMRVATAMVILLLVAIVSLQATPTITLKAQQLLASADPVVPVNMNTIPSQDIAPARHNEYLERARQALRKLRYTKPAYDNAYYYYQRALEESPGNEQALQGIAEIAEIHADLVEWALGLREYGKAREYLATGMQIDPHNKRLLELAANDALK